MGSRFTFRRPAGEVAYQRQLRDEHNHLGAPEGVSLKLKRSRVKPVSKSFAKNIILRYEWLGTMGNTSWHFGMFFGFHCAGVTCVGGAHAIGGAYNHMLYGVERDELRVLARGACVHWAPPGANSRLIAWTRKLLEQDRNGKVLIAFADSEAGEIGTVYQAAGWYCLGRGQGSHLELISPEGKIVDQAIIRAYTIKTGRSFSWYLDALHKKGWQSQRANPKLRYAIPIDTKDEALKARLDGMAVDYPKRDTRAPDGRAEAPTSVSGSIPTRPLQENDA